MKKILLIIFIIILLNTKNINSNNIEDTSHTYKLYTLIFENLDTKNINNYFSNIKIETIYPKINPIYKNQIGNIVYKTTNNTTKQEIEKFKNEYLKIIKKNRYSDYNYLYTNGIEIEKMEVYLKNDELNKLLNSELDITIK